ncbi:MAG: hypothetical protein DHS20C02_15120 [Micavibrio sp.]|nr:MAG: hypothetical protein DHS20C02_15120 [Micavibrio sp.]
MAYSTLHSEAAYHRASVEPKIFKGFIGTSVAIQSIYKKIESAARSREIAFITGESGTGKQVCAEAIHQLSDRSHQPFIHVNCAITDYEEVIDRAQSGTLFLDEITEMGPDIQSKLLRSLENISSRDIRVICATNRNPIAEISKSLFRRDLYYRLHVLPIYMPPLRERGEDAVDIAQTLLRQYALEEEKQFRAFSDNAEFLLKTYSWPGNIRELQNVIRNVVVMNEGEIVTKALLPSVMLDDKRRSSVEGMDLVNSALSVVAGASISPGGQLVKPLLQTEREAIEYAISYCRGNISRAAALLEVAPSTIYRKKSVWDQGESPA